MTGNEALGTMLAKLQRLGPLDDADKATLASLTFHIRKLEPGAHYSEDGETIDSCCMLIGGYACRSKLSRGGGRQIVAFNVPGDFLDLQHLLLPRADHNIEALTEATLACVSASRLTRVIERSPAIARLLWQDTLIEGSMFREWVLNVGRRDARSRIAHLLCEFVARRKAAGAAAVDALIPITQEQLADATGLTTVHVNRMLQRLREEGAITFRNSPLRVIDYDRLKNIAEFSPRYMHQAA